MATDLTNHKPIIRGHLSGAIIDRTVYVNWGAVTGYPDGDSVLWKLHEDDIEDMIALLKALKQHRSHR